MWASLATLGVKLGQVPPFLLTGLGLVIGSVPAWPFARQWRVRPATLLLGVYGLFGFHFLLFIALRHAPPVQANQIGVLVYITPLASTALLVWVTGRHFTWTLALAAALIVGSALAAVRAGD